MRWPGGGSRGAGVRLGRPRTASRRPGHRLPIAGRQGLPLPARRQPVCRGLGRARAQLSPEAVTSLLLLFVRQAAAEEASRRGDTWA